jgi:hypothetical protein
MSDHTLAIVSIVLGVFVALIGCGVAVAVANHPDRVKAAKVFFSAAAILGLLAAYFWTVSTTCGLPVRVAADIVWLAIIAIGLIAGFQFANRSSIAELGIPSSAFISEPLWPRKKKLGALTIIGILAVTALLNATRESDVVASWMWAHVVIFWGVPWKWVLPAIVVTAIPTAIGGFLIARKMRPAGSHASLGGLQLKGTGTVSDPCPDKRLHALAESDKASIKNLVRIPWIAYRPHFDKKEPYIDFVFSIFNNSLYDIVIDNSIKKGDIWCDSSDEPFYYEPKIRASHPIGCGSRDGTNFVIRHVLTVEEISRFEGKDNVIIGFGNLEITFAGTEQFPEILPTRLETKYYLETKKGEWWYNPNQREGCAFAYTDEQWALLSSSNTQEVATLKADNESLKAQLSQAQSESEREKIPHRRELIREWRKMVVDVDRKYKSGDNNANDAGDRFAEILERQPGYKSLRQHLRQETLDELKAEMVREGIIVEVGANKITLNPADKLIEMLTIDIGAKEAEWGLP